MKSLALALLVLSVPIARYAYCYGEPECVDSYLGGLDTSVETARSGDGWMHGGLGTAGYWISRTFEDGTPADEGEFRIDGNIALALHLGRTLALDLGLTVGYLLWGDDSFSTPPECSPTGQKTTSVGVYGGPGCKLSAGFATFSLALLYRSGLGYCVNCVEGPPGIPTFLLGFGNPERWTFAVGGQGLAVTHHRGWVHVGAFFLPLFGGASYGGPLLSDLSLAEQVFPNYRPDRFNYAFGVKLGFGRY